MYKYLFLDLDDTILDFKKAESIAVSKIFQMHGVTPTAEVVSLYSRINVAHWERLERGEITREQVKVGRFAQVFEQLGVEVDPAACTREYEQFLAIGHYFLPGSEQAVKNLSKKYRLFLASNGTASVQKGRLTSAGLYPYFEQSFISEEIGANKPSLEYFQAAFARIPDFDPKYALMVGDSLTSDIRGGNNAGMDTCWVNSKGAPRREGFSVNYEITALSELEGLLDRLH